MNNSATAVKNENTLVNKALNLEGFVITSKVLAEVLGMKEKRIHRDLDQMVSDGIADQNDYDTRYLGDKDRKVKRIDYLSFKAVMVMVTGYSIADVHILTDYFKIKGTHVEEREDYTKTYEAVAQKANKLVTLKSLYLHKLRQHKNLQAQIKSYGFQTEALWKVLNEERAEAEVLREEIKELKTDRDAYATALESTSNVLVVSKREALKQEQKYTALHAEFSELQDEIDAEG